MERKPGESQLHALRVQYGWEARKFCAICSDKAKNKCCHIKPLRVARTLDILQETLYKIEQLARRQ